MTQPTDRRAPRAEVRTRPSGPPTLATVADEAGVSRQTVSNALNNPDLLRPETLERVQEVIGRLGYSPNRAARQLRTRSTELVRRFHPDHNGGDRAHEKALQTVIEAYANLKARPAFA